MAGGAAREARVRTARVMALHRGLVELMAAVLAGGGVQVRARGREEALPGGLASGAG